MLTPTFIILADRGCLKAFAIEDTATRGAVPRLVENFQIADAHGRYEDKVSDQAGSFPTGGTLGQGNSIAETLTRESEMESRIFRQLAEHITNLLRQHQPELWAFAAPSEINGAIIDGLDRDLHEKLRWNLKRDLIHTDASELLARFEDA